MFCILKSYNEIATSPWLTQLFAAHGKYLQETGSVRKSVLSGGCLWEETVPAILVHVIRKLKAEHTRYFSLGSGIGTDCFVAAECGFSEITGYDISPMMIQIARNIQNKITEATAAELPISFQQQDMFTAPINKVGFYYVYLDKSIPFFSLYDEFERSFSRGSRLLINTVDPLFLRGKNKNCIERMSYKIHDGRSYYMAAYAF
jgi:hypothetical protein